MAIECGHARQPLAWLHVGFALTGVGTTLFGCALPGLNLVWHLDDRHAGVIFAAQFTGSALGAVLVWKDFLRSILCGYLLLIISAVSVAFCPRSIRVLAFFAFGLGLGLAMTATSMLIARAKSARRGAALSILNVAWGMGAAASPFLASLWAERWFPPYLFLALSVVLTMTLLLLMSSRRSLIAGHDAATQEPSSPRELKLISIFAVIAFFYVGTEASVSGWMMTYVHRLTISGNAWAAIATSCFWIALICGRILVTVILRLLSEAQLLTSALMMGLMSVLLLLLSHTAPVAVLSATITGLALAPIFPLCLARVISLMHDSPESKWMFFVSGLGGAVLPWMTGELSAHFGSLHSGLLVATFALATMIVLDRIASDRRIPFQQRLRHP